MVHVRGCQWDNAAEQQEALMDGGAPNN